NAPRSVTIRRLETLDRKVEPEDGEAVEPEDGEAAEPAEE
ncbi:MAG: hypothetical protein ACI9WU_000827, partial [Myxococcota bacterium]